MGLKERFDSDLIAALKAGDELTSSVLRLLKSALKNEEIARQEPLDDEAVTAVLRREAKRRRESIEQFKAAGRQELADKEQKELFVLEQYLPPAASEDDIRSAVQKYLAGGEKEFGAVMKSVMAEFKGEAEGAVVSRIVREELSRHG